MPEWTVNTKEYGLERDKYVRICQRINRKLIIRYSLFVCLVTVFIISLLMRPYGWVVGLALSPGYYLLGHYSYKRYFRKFYNATENRGLFLPHIVTFTNEKVTSTQRDGAMSSYPWSAIIQHVRIDDSLALFVNQINFLYVPRFVFESVEDWSRVLAYATSIVPVRK